MRSNNTFTYLLSGLLGVLILAAGYLALERRKEDARKAEELRRDQEQLERTLSSMSDVNSDTTSGSAYVSESGKANKNGIEGDDTPTKPAAKTTTTAKTPATVPAATTAKTPAATAPKTLAPATKTATTTPKSTLTAKGGTTLLAAQNSAPVKSGRYLVVTGAFSLVENARGEMEKLVKMGYRDAEVIKYKTNLWRVVAARSNKTSEAGEYERDLERQGIDAMFVDSYKK